MRKVLLNKLNPDIVTRVVAENKTIPNLEAKLSYMFQFTMVKWDNTKRDPFSITNTDTAVGYRIIPSCGRYIAEPYVWKIVNEDRLTGHDIGERIPNAIYVGVRVSDEIRKKFGISVHSHVLGNLDALKQCSIPRL